MAGELYVYLKAENYKKYGAGGGGEQALNSMLQEKKSRLLQSRMAGSANKDDAQALEEILNNIIKTYGTEEKENLIDKIKNQVRKYIEEEFSNMISLDDNLKASHSGGSSRRYLKRGKNYKSVAGIKTAISRMVTNGTITEDTKNIIMTQMNQEEQNGESAIGTYDIITKHYNMFTTAQGTAFQKFLQFLFNSMISGAMNDGVASTTGSDYSNGGDSSALTQIFGADSPIKVTKKAFGKNDVSINISAVQQKLEEMYQLVKEESPYVQYYLQMIELCKLLKQGSFSAKSYAGGISNLQISNSFTMDQLIGSDDQFLKHYINIIATHQDGNLTMQKSLIQNQIKMLALYEALSGKTQYMNSQQKQAGYLIVNDTLTGKIRVFSTSSIVDGVISNNLDITSTFSQENGIDIKGINDIFSAVNNNKIGMQANLIQAYQRSETVKQIIVQKLSRTVTVKIGGSQILASQK